MEIEAKKVPWVDGICIDVRSADMAIYFTTVKAVHVSSRTDGSVSLHICRDAGVLGSVGLPLRKGVALLAELESLGVEIHGDFDAEEVA